MRILWLFLFLGKTLLFSLDLNFPFSAYQSGSANYLLLQENPANCYHNPALFSAGYSFNYHIPFSIKEISVSSLSASFSLSTLNASIGNQYISDNSYSENIIFFSLNKSFKSVSAGSNLRIINQKTGACEPVNAYLLDMGISYKNYPFKSALCVQNITESSYKTLHFPVRYNAEVAYNLLSNAIVSISASKEDDYKLEPILASSVRLYPNVTLMTAYDFEASQSSYGISIKKNSYEIAYAVRIHPILDPTHSLSVSIFSNE